MNPSPAASPVSPHAAQLRAAVAALQKQAARISELETAVQAAHDPVAIVGIGCRFPGGAHGPEAFWEKLRTGFDAVREVPPERWATADFFDADPDAAGKIATNYGAFLDEVDKFDAAFFRISPREAATMDPQQRLLLETAWEAFEHAGLPPDSLAGSATGVFVALTVIDYLRLIYRHDLRRIDSYCATGNVANIAAGRLSYFFGLRGPALAVDTACSSSLVAIHLACQSLRSGESTHALAAGVNLILAPDNSVAVSRARMLAPDGRCKTFDAAADGYARGEGCGVLVLQRLSHARRDGRRILGVIRGTAVAQDGARAGLTVPHGPAQAAVVRTALAAAGVKPAEVGYVEAHGTGTSLGDPIEAEALAGVFGRDLQRTTPLVIGSLKTNVGHMESAAGVGGIIKTVLALSHGEIPPHLHFKREHPELRLAEIPAVVPTRMQAWPAGYARRIAGVSSFGSSGTIAHVVLEAPEADPTPAATTGAGPHTLVFSAKTPAALKRLGARYRALLSALPGGVTPAEICYTAAVGRSLLAHHRVVTGRDAAELAASLAQPLTETALPELAPPATRLVTLPAYPFERTRHWIEPEPAATMAGVCGGGAMVDRAPDAPDALQFGIMFFNGSETGAGERYRLVLEAARYADARGFSSVWAPERHFTDFGGLYPNPATLHAALARETKHLRLMAGSCVLPLHHVLRLVEEWSMVDNLSGGRAGISFAPGWNPADFALAPDRYAGRQDELFRGIAEARRLWRGEKIRVQGGDGREIEVRAYPTPVQAALPLWITAAGNPRTFERAGEVGANLLTHLLDQDPDELAEKIARYRTARAKAGHDPAAGRVTVMLHTFVGADAAAVVAKTRAPYTHYLRENLHLLRGLGASRGRDIDLAALSESERTAFVEFLYDRFVATRALIGTPASCAPLVRRLAAAGASEIACLLDFGATTDDVLAMLPELTAFKAAVAGELRVNLSGPNVHPTGGAETRGRAPEGGHEIVWRPVTLVPQEPVPAEPQAWLVCGDGHGVGASLIERLRARGQSATAWQPGQPVPSGLARVVDLRPLEPGAELAGTVELVQRSTGRLWTVTCGAQAVGGVVPDPMGAAFWGLLRVLPVEQPARWGGLIDLDPSLPAEAQAEALWLALTTSTREDQVALRSGQAAAARLVTAPLISDPALAGFRPRADAAYLITGGLGGVGFAVARWLAAAGARHLVLWGRKAPDAARAADLAALERTGVTVTVRSVDLGDATAVTLALAETPGVPLRGVFHAAGAWQDEALAELTPESIGATWRAKAAGAAHLDAALHNVELDAFVMFSAFSALLPAPHQGNYAAANAFLDALAHRRRARGAAALSVGWGPWSEIGFATTEYGRRAHSRLESLGIARFAPDEGLGLLERALGAGRPHVAAMKVDWSRLFTADPAAKWSPLLGELLAAHAPAAEPAVEAGRIARSLAAWPADEQATRLTTEFAALIAAVLRMNPADVSPRSPLADLGVDSLVAIEIKNRLQRDAGIDVPLTRLLESPTLAQLAAEWLPQVKLAAMAATPAPLAGAMQEVEI
jgi:natural product biosynthesis luciferase-like monooxygenase protein